MNSLATRPINHNIRLTKVSFIALSALVFPIAIGMFAVMMYIPTYYGIDLGIGLTAVGIIIGLGRFIDVFTDPLIGYLSDQTQSRFGPRKPWIIIGTPILSIALWMLCSPPSGVGVSYLFIATTLYFFGLTITMVPFGALGLEISNFHHERTALISTRIGFNLAGSLIAVALPFALTLGARDTLGLLGVIIIVFMPLSLLLFIIGSPRSRFETKHPHTPLLEAFKDAWRRPDFRKLISAFALVQIGNTLNAGLMLLFVTYVLGRADLFGLIMIVTAVFTGLGLPLWYYLSKKIGKYRTWKVSILMCTISLIGVLFIREGNITLAMMCCGLYGLAFGCDGIMPSSILADIVYDNEESKKKRLGGLSAAALGFVTKLAIIAPMGIAFPILGWLDLGKTETTSAVQVTALIILYALLPIIARLAGFAVIRRNT